MGFFDRLFGRDEPEQQQPDPARQPRRRGAVDGGQLTDEQALERYRYMLRTAPPEAIEQAHAEAFAQLTPEQRAMVLRELSNDLPAHERAAVDPNQDDPRALARMATRAELRQPGTMERTFSGPAFMGSGMGGFGGGMFGGSFLSTIAGVAVGSLVGNALYDSFAHGPDYAGGDTGYGDTSSGAEGGVDVGTDPSADPQAGDFGGLADPLGGDAGGDFGADLGGDFGGDFGGTEF